MTSTVGRQFRVEHASVDAELIQEQFESITFVHGIDEQNGFAGNEFQFEQSVNEDEFIFFLAL